METGKTEPIGGESKCLCLGCDSEEIFPGRIIRLQFISSVKRCTKKQLYSEGGAAGLGGSGSHTKNQGLFKSGEDAWPICLQREIQSAAEASEPKSDLPDCSTGPPTAPRIRHSE